MECQLVALTLSGWTTPHLRKEAAIHPRLPWKGCLPLGKPLPLSGPASPCVLTRSDLWADLLLSRTRIVQGGFSRHELQEKSTRFLSLSLSLPCPDRSRARGAGGARLESPRHSLDAAEKCLRDLRAQAAG